MGFRKLAFLLAVSTVFATPAFASTVVLDFENIAPYPSDSTTPILDYYNGGTSGAGTSGTNYGVSFSSNALALCLNTPGVPCSNTSRGGLGSPTSQQGALYFLDGSETFLNYAAGFTDGFSFFYSDPYTSGASVSVFDGLNGTGNVIATIALGLTASAGCDSSYSGGVPYCPFVPVGVSFTGIAKSISFAGTANFVTYDDVTFGSPTPGSSAPEPGAWALMIVGFGAVGATLRKRRAPAVRYDFA